MRTSAEVRDELEAIIKEHDTTDGTEDILIGWIEALEWVLDGGKHS